MDKWKQALEEHMQLQQLTRHHRNPRSNNGSDKPENISLVPLKKHQAFHALFSNDDVYKIAEKLNNVWIDPRFELIVREKILHP